MNYKKVLKNKYINRIIPILLLIVSLVSIDLYSKEIARQELKYKEKKSFLNNSFHLVYAENKGGMLSLGSELPSDVRNYIFQGFVSIALIGLSLLAILHNNISSLQRFAVTLFIAGGLGNLLSRIFDNGRVVDFMLIELFEYRTGIFNIADVFITCGMIIILISNFFIRRSRKNQQSENTAVSN